MIVIGTDSNHQDLELMKASISLPPAPCPDPTFTDRFWRATSDRESGKPRRKKLDLMELLKRLLV